MKNDGGPAYPVTITDRSGQIAATQCGMTLRDYFAAAAMQGVLAASWGNPMGCQGLANDSYRVADAMLKERMKNEIN